MGIYVAKYVAQFYLLFRFLLSNVSPIEHER